MSQIERRALLGAVGLLGAATLAQAGSLNPPAGPVLPTMKPLTDIEPRTAVQSLPGDSGSQYVISQPGSYYLTGPINGVSAKNGIAINAPNVTLDLCGFALLGVVGSLAGIASVNPNGNLIVANGSVRGWGGTGVDLGGNFNSLVYGIVSSNNGGAGISLGDACAIRDCVSRDNSGDGIVAGFNCSVNHCSAVGSVNGYGIATQNDCEIGDCSANFNKLAGIGTGVNCVIARCTAAQNVGSGIVAFDGCRVVDCSASQNGVAGILLSNNGSVRGCVAVANQGSGVSTASGTGIGCGHGCSVSECNATNNTGNGLSADYGSSINACVALGNTRAGIVCYSGSVVSGNSAYNNGGDGIRAGGLCLIERNAASTNGGGIPGSAGIHALGSGNRVIGNHCQINTGTGILSDGTDTTVGNSCSGNNTANYNPASGSSFGPLTTPANTTATAWANF